MRCAFVSDIHANLQAWKAVLLDIRSTNVDKIICLGDVVGYGPNPADVLASMYTSVDHFVLGNHDAVVCGKMDPALFNDNAQRIIAWTQKQLSSRAPDFLRSLPLTLRAASFRCAHATFAMPATFDYIIEPRDALASWRAVDDPLLFVGHTHQPGIYVVGRSGTPHRLDPTDFMLEAGKRYLVNVGSVGQPRDGDTRASYCVLDTDTASVTWRRVPFDLDAYRAAMTAAGIPLESSHFLKADPTRTPPLRDMLSFSPVVTPSNELQRTREVQELTALRKRVRRLRRVVLATLLAAAILTGGVGGLWWRHHTRAVRIPGREMVGRNALAAPLDTELTPPLTTPTPAGQALPGWSVLLGNKRKQSAHVEPRDGVPTLVLRSRVPRDTLRLRSAPLRVVQEMRMGMQADFFRGSNFQGEVSLAMALTRETDDGRREDDNFLVKTPRPNPGDWEHTQYSTRIPARALSVTLEIRGNFTGEVLVRDAYIDKRSDPE